MGSVYFYRCDDDKRTLHKKLKELGHVDNAVIKEDSTVMDLNLEWSYADLGYPDWLLINYVWVEDTQRYYFVGNTRMLNGGRVLFPLHCDVLYTANASERKDIDNLSALIARQENMFNTYFKDELMPIRDDVYITTQRIGSFGKGEGRCYAFNVLNNQISL